MAGDKEFTVLFRSRIGFKALFGLGWAGLGLGSVRSGFGSDWDLFWKLAAITRAKIGTGTITRA